MGHKRPIFPWRNSTPQQDLMEEEMEFMHEDSYCCDKCPVDFCPYDGDNFALSCDDYFDDNAYDLDPCIEMNSAKSRRLSRRKTHIKKKKRLMLIINRNKYNPYPGYIKWGYVDGKWTPVGKYIQYPKNSKKQSYYKKYSNRIVRRSKTHIPNGNSYRRLFDYSWEIY